ncbi:MAG: hypothetical protein ACKVW3_17305 [Phycisphaerales bacterium]
MRVALSPYHLTTREPAAMAALLLAQDIITLLPGPAPAQAGGETPAADAVAAARRIPAYLTLMRAWEWSMPLWRAASVRAHPDALSQALAALDSIADNPRFEPLRPLMRPDLFADSDAFLRALSEDLLKSGPSPAVSVPVQAGLDRLAARFGLVAARSDRASVVQRAETAMCARLCSFAVPVLLRAGGERLLRARARLAPPLADLRAAIGTTGDSPDISNAAAAYADAFESALPDLIREMPDEERAIPGTVAVTLVRMPDDACLLAAADAVGRPRADPASAQPVRTFTAMIVRVIGRPAPR